MSSFVKTLSGNPPHPRKRLSEGVEFLQTKTVTTKNLETAKERSFYLAIDDPVSYPFKNNYTAQNNYK